MNACAQRRRRRSGTKTERTLVWRADKSVKREFLESKLGKHMRFLSQYTKAALAKGQRTHKHTHTVMCLYTNTDMLKCERTQRVDTIKSKYQLLLRAKLTANMKSNFLKAGNGYNCAALGAVHHSKVNVVKQARKCTHMHIHLYIYMYVHILCIYNDI